MGTRAVQQYLADRGYQEVTVFCTGSCRNNLGNWVIRSVAAPPRKKDFEYFAVKDRVMAREARCGVMLWDGKSRGTLENILNLLEGRKRVRVYLARSQEFYTVSTDDELSDLANRAGVPLPGHRQTALPI